MFYTSPMEKLFELQRRTFDTPQFAGIEFIEVEAKSIINDVRKLPGVPFNWTINPYRGCSHACSYCFARVTHTYMDMNAGTDFESKIVVKVNAPELLRNELRAKRWAGESIAMGTATDPYQRAEGRYRITRRIVETLAEYRNPFSILTKGTLIMRDLDLLQEAAEVTDISTAFSIGTVDEDVWRSSEPGTAHPMKRVEAVAKLNEAGIPCGVLVAPILPGISDGDAQLRAVVNACVDAGAVYVSPILLHLRPIVRDVYMEWLRGVRPDLIATYDQMYKRSYAASGDRNALSKRVAELVAEAGGIRRPHRRRRGARNAGHARQEGARIQARQLTLV